MLFRSMLLATAGVMATTAALPTAAHADARKFIIALPSQSLSDSLYAVSRTTGVQLIFTESALLAVKARPVSGTMTTDQILERLLDGTGYAYRFTNPRTVRVFRGEVRRFAASSTTASAIPVSVAQQEVPAAPAAPAAQADPGQALESEQIVVTGSRLQRDGFEAPIPTNVINQSDLQSSGFVELSQALVDIPGVAIGDSNVGIPAGTAQNSGTSSVNLRGLGANRTLVLIDGHRTVSNAANRTVVSLNTIPTDFVERVDIITGAASAIYGSDAIAGVVNVITESNLKGFRLKGRAGTSLGASGGDELSASATFGTKFADDRGYFLVSANYEQDFGLFSSDRLERSSRNYTFVPTTNTTIEPDLSTDIPGGRFRGSSYFYDDAGVLRTNYVTANGYNDRTLDTLRVPRDMLGAAAKLTFEVSSAFKPFAQVHFSDLDTEYSRAPVGIRNDTQVTIRDPRTGLPAPDANGGFQRFTPGSILASNPFYQATGIPGTTPVTFRRRMNEVGNRQFFNDRDTLRIWAGANGKIGDWFYEASYSHGEFWQHQLRTGGVNLLKLQRGLNATRVNGNIVCSINADANPANDDPACVPVNLFGINSISPAAANYIKADAIFDSHLKQQVFQAYASGDLFSLPAGKVGTVIGVEYRREHGSLTTDDQTRTGYTTNSGIPGFNDGFTVKEAFGELSIPVLKDKPWAQDLTLDLAGRVSDYSQPNVGTVGSYRGGITYAPMSEVRFRSAYGTAQRAPDLAELYSPPRDDSDSGVSDPCVGVRLTSVGTLANNCRAQPGIAAAIANGSAFTQASTTISSPNGGNLDLKNETAKTLTLGVVVEPVRRMNLSFDFYHIKVKDAIDSNTITTILTQCYTAAGGTANNRFCNFINRSTTDGQIQEVIQLEENLNSIVTSGFDVHFNYLTPRDWAGIPGRFDLRADWTHTLKYETEYVGLNGVQVDNDLGEIDRPKDVVTMRAGYEVGPGRIQWRTRYYGPTVATNERLAAFRAGAPDDYLFYDAYWRHDLYASINPNLGGVDVRLYAGINNVFNKTGRPVPDGANDYADNNYTSLFGVVGRTFYTGLNLRF